MNKVFKVGGLLLILASVFSFGEHKGKHHTARKGAHKQVVHRTKAIAPEPPASPVLPDGNPNVQAESAIAIDEATGRVLYAKASDAQRYMASTTKILTALIVLEKTKLTDVVTAPMDIEKVGESSLHLKPGEKLTIKSLLYAILLRSANDACVTAAIHVAGSVPKFAEMMNQKAKQLGCTRSNFVTPNGLHDPKHYTTAYDLATIARAAMQNPIFRDIVKTKRMAIDRSLSKDKLMVNRNKTLLHDLSADGIKTGYTVPAGHCFVGSAVRNNFRVITVVLKSPNWQQDTHFLMDWCFDTYSRVVLAKEGQTVDGMKVAKSIAALAKFGEAKPRLLADEEKGTLAIDYGSGKSQIVQQIAPKVTLAAAALPSTPASRKDVGFAIGACALAAGYWIVRSRSRRFGMKPKQKPIASR